MTAAPSYVAVKRKRDDAPIQSLVLEEQSKPDKRINVEYRLESVSQPSNSQPNGNYAPVRSQNSGISQNGGQSDFNAPKKPSGPRHFELATTGRAKRSADDAGFLPTFVERPTKRMTMFGTLPPQAPKAPSLKRPGTRRQPITDRAGSRTEAPRPVSEPSAGLVAAMNAFAMEEAAAEETEQREKPRVIVQPKRPIRRRREPEPEMQDTVMTSDDDDFVYDIYIRSAARSAPSAPSASAVEPTTSTSQSSQPIDPSAPRTPSLIPFDPDNAAPASVLESYAPSYADTEVGYLILPPDESSSSYFWTASPSHSPSRGGAHPDGSSSNEGEDEDSNAEDYYGADYPEDEVDSDDEAGVGEWQRFRRNASDDEDEYRDPGWAGRRGSDEWSDSSLEADRMMNPWRKFGGRT